MAASSGYDVSMKLRQLLIVLAAAVVALPVVAQDATRGARLYADTPKLTGQPVAACVSCHADIGTLREVLRNRRGQCDDPALLARWLEAVISGAQPGAVNAKAQYRGVLKAKDLRDLAVYIACVKQAGDSGLRLTDRDG
jgi:cytochrome c553